MSTPQSVAERAVLAVGCGYDLSDDIRLEKCKTGYDLSDDIRLEKCSRLVDVGGGGREVVVPGGVVVRGVPWSIRCDKGERTRFRSDVLSFHQMSEHFNQSMSLPCKIPSGLFNAMFDFQGCWQKDACGTKSLLFDGWFVTLYSIELMRSEVVLLDSVKNDVPSRWDPAALTKFIEKYGTHIITGVKMGGKDVIHLKQLRSSSLGANEMQEMTKKLANEAFSEDATEDVNGRFAMDLHEPWKELKECHGFVMKSFGPSVVSCSKEHGVVTVHVRRGGTDYIQSHKQWLSTVPMAPDVILMSFIPITSLLNGVPGSGFLSHAINHYLRYKPPIEELHQFLEFQLPRQWAPVFGDLPLGPRPKKQKFPSLRFSLMGPKLCINTEQVCSGNRPVTGIRLYLEGMKNDCLAIHLQHLSALPDTFQFTNDNNDNLHNEEMSRKDYYVPFRCSIFSHVCTAPVQYSKACINDSACIVTKAWLEVREIGVKQVLFLMLGFSAVASAKIRRSEWDGHSSFSRKSGYLSALIGTRLSTGYNSPPMPAEVELNSAFYPGGPPVPVRLPKMLEFIDTTETMRGPEDPPGYWLVTGAKLCIENGKILVKAKYSLVSLLSEDEIPFCI